jgi:hypothetical protein
MVGVGGLLEGVLHQETSHGRGGGLPVGVRFSKMGVATNRDKTQSYSLRNAIIRFLTIGVYTFFKITMSPPDGTDNPTGSWTIGEAIKPQTSVVAGSTADKCQESARVVANPAINREGANCH